MVAPFSRPYCKIWLCVCLNTEKPFFPTERAQVLLKYGARDFQNSRPFKRLACFYVTISGNLERFQYFDFELDFLKIENLFQKTGVSLFSRKH